MEITKNGLYGGAPAFTARSADGWIYYSYVGEGPDGFGAYVWRWKDGANERVPLEYFSTMRPSMTVESDGLYITLFRNDEKAIVRVKVPGFISPAQSNNSGGNTQPLPTPTEAVDTYARGQISALSQKLTSLETKLNNEANNLWNAIIADRKRISAVEGRDSDGITLDQVWQKALDAQYWGITSPDSDARKELIKLVVATAPNTGQMPGDIVEIVATEVDKAVNEIITKVVEVLQPKTDTAR